MSDAQLLIDALWARNPGAVELAKLTSIAVQAEPELLRKLRLQLLPEVDASAEADLWLSELVDSKSPFAMVLDAGAQRRLQQLLAADPETLSAAAAIIAEAHSGIEAALRTEETVTALALQHPAAADLIQATLGPMVATLDRAPNPGLAGWAMRAFRQFPDAVQATDAAKRLFVAGFTGGGPGEKEFPRIRVGVRMLATTVEIFVTGERGPRLRIIEVPDTGSQVILDLSWGKNQPVESVVFGFGEVIRMPRQSDELFLTTVLGDTYVVFLNAAAEDWALVIGVGSDGLAPAQEMAEWLTSPDGARIPREQVIVRVASDHTTGVGLQQAMKQLTGLEGEWRRVIVYYAGVLAQEGDDLLMMPADAGWHHDAHALRLSEMLSKLRRRRFREVVIIAEGRGEPVVVPFEKLPIPRGTSMPVAIVTAPMPGEVAVGEFTRALLRALRTASIGSYLSVRGLSRLMMEDIEAVMPGVAERIRWFAAGEINLIEPRTGVFELRIDIPEEWREKRILLIGAAGEVEQELRLLGRRAVRFVPPGLYFVEIPELSFSKPVTAGLRGLTSVLLQWVPRDEWIVVAGTGAFHLTHAENEMVRSMARKLAGSGFRLIVGGGEGVDYVAGEIYTKTLQTFGHSNTEFLRQYSVRRPHYGGGPHIPEQRPVDIVRAAILIGGHEGTRSYVKRADQASVPIIPIAGTGSAAEETYNSFAVRDKLPEWLTNRVVDGTTADAMAEKVIRYLETILSRNLLATPAPVPPA